ncbi:hypothetical protein Pmani_030812 [Petrolisthes manimaculis]|uniref:Uncharacterized protein n=1 Tax=Petrolisthes manimaculis TaxID=1843537 RepID=A0AAE1TVJ6_9EUCA|nr:hypothetical protein Pmani_030812 [Petrolisthes manimaculis]
MTDNHSTSGRPTGRLSLGRGGEQARRQVVKGSRHGGGGEHVSKWTGGGWWVLQMERRDLTAGGIKARQFIKQEGARQKERDMRPTTVRTHRAGGHKRSKDAKANPIKRRSRW